MSLNKVLLIGRLGQDPEKRMLSSGESVVTFSLATSNVWKDRNTGERKESTEWHRITLFRALADIAAQYLNKGRQIYIEGHIKSHRYVGKDGVERTSYDIIADQMVMLGGRNEGTSTAPYPSSYGGPQNPGQGNTPGTSGGYTKEPSQSVDRSSVEEKEIDSSELLSDDIPF